MKPLEKLALVVIKKYLDSYNVIYGINNEELLSHWIHYSNSKCPHAYEDELYVFPWACEDRVLFDFLIYLCEGSYIDFNL